MFFGAQKNIQNQVALRRALQTFLLDVFKKDFLLFGLWLCRSHQRCNFTTWSEVGKECQPNPGRVDSIPQPKMQVFISGKFQRSVDDVQ